ncbi:MAG TPA: (deoxy)nucleoside triphosphate pyrophosphohydrolase [Marmoricola sp.]|nr:(deoxy)nucleoside triphosphate pyrophosphohydrolase [Marmoricola sp.]
MPLVVGAAILSDGRLLAARRATPPVGGWELPGGKVEPGESPEAALVREIDEELGCHVRVTGWLPGSVEVGAGLRLEVAVATLVRGEPVPREHDAIRWLRPGELDAVAWLPADVPFVEQLRAVLGGVS